MSVADPQELGGGVYLGPPADFAVRGLLLDRLRDLLQALGCGSRGDFDVDKLEKRQAAALKKADIERPD